MSIKNYRFVSPGVFVNEIDNSQLPASPAGIGPVIIGRAAQGPALRPTTVTSFEEFVRVFGPPAPGGGGNDVWRSGNDTSATTYGAYAAQAYLRNSSPLTYVRLLGNAASDFTVGSGEAGWDQKNAWGILVGEAPGNHGSGERPWRQGGFDFVLAGIVYAPAGVSVALSGNVALTGAAGPTIGGAGVQGSSWIVSDTGTAKQFRLVMTGSGPGSTGTSTIVFNFDRTSPRYIRKVLNTNPQLTNSGITDASTRLNYWLGETFDRHLASNITGSQTWGAIVRINNTAGASNGSAGNHQASLQSGETPQIIACRTSTNPTSRPLFKFVALDQPGDWSNKNLKISIQDIKRSPDNDSDYGTFSVVVRHLRDSDNVVQVIEQFNNCDLNPDSLGYVGRKIGTQYTTWDSTERRYVNKGDWANVSQYIRIELNSDVDAGLTSADLLPFGFEGIIKYSDDLTILPATAASTWLTGAIDYDHPTPDITPGGTLLRTAGGAAGCKASVFYPAPELRVSASDGNLPNNTDAYFGFQTTTDAGGSVFDPSNIDLLRPRGAIVDEMFTGDADTERSITFTLDDISGSQGSWISGSFTKSTPVGQSLTRANGLVAGVLDAGFDRFTVPMYGGFDGTAVTEMDPFANRNLGEAPTDKTNYVFNSLRQAIDSLADPEVIEMNMASIPGLTQEGLTTNLVRICEDRADALAVIDLQDAFQPREESTSVDRLNTQSTISTIVSNMRSRNLNSSYGCAYYPWVRARDTINGAFIWLPPSVPAIGTFSSAQRKTQVWFAPAGFNRGGLTEGSAGIPVVDVAHQLRRKDRDDLYASNVNPIAKFPNEGIVIFGQKTLQVTPSALDRINVRRLMIFVKKRISRIAAKLLFDPNVQQTWLRFKGQVDPFLANVKTNFGLSDYKVILDESTTTPDLVDQNIMYAKIFLKPTRAIEYIAIDFNITRTGASFTD
tara:strand:- start:783 stop:3632 length:2850 start_codon:yes stop_codon:yes gene_type:complete